MIITSNNLSMKIIVHNSRVIVISPIQEESEEVVNGEIISLRFKEFHIKKGEILTLKKQKYKIKSIKKQKNGIEGSGYYLYTHTEITKTTTFLMPFLGGNKNHYRFALNFTNAFLSAEVDPEKTYYGKYLYLLYRYVGDLEYHTFDKKIREHSLFVDALEPDEFHTLYKFKLPEEYSEDIELILQGKYSKISVKSKQLILNFHGSRKDRPLGQILLKSPERRKQMEIELHHKIPKENELLSPFDLEKEIYSKEYIIN